MLKKEDYDRLKAAAAEYFKRFIAVTEKEMSAFQVAEYDLGCVDTIGLELIEYVNTERCCAKELVLLPGQICPEHRHPASLRRGRQGGNLPLPLRHGLSVRRGRAEHRQN